MSTLYDDLCKYDDFYEEEAGPYSCDNCGPWCPEWGGDGLCMIAIRSMAEEYEREHPLARLTWIARRAWSFLASLPAKILPSRCPDCGRFYIFSKDDHQDCLPF
jgi:hypothetical protein